MPMIKESEILVGVDKTLDRFPCRVLQNTESQNVGCISFLVPVAYSDARMCAAGESVRAFRCDIRYTLKRQVSPHLFIDITSGLYEYPDGNFVPETRNFLFVDTKFLHRITQFSQYLVFATDWIKEKRSLPPTILEFIY